MAIMVPKEIGFYVSKSGENLMFDALKKLPDDYFVFHSYRTINLFGNLISENEADFLIFHPSYGCLIIEAKNGHVYRDEEGTWHYKDGTRMKDPFDQACSSMYAIRNKFIQKYAKTNFEHLVDGCKFLYAVWFPSYTKDEIENACFGPNIDKKIILTKDTLFDPLASIEKIMKNMQKYHVVYTEARLIEDGKNYKHLLSKEDSMKFFKNILCPSFDIIPSHEKDHNDETYLALLKEQSIVLDFLCEQRSAAIAGTSGTGKTLIAVERARRLNEYGKKVLFLCFNSNLKKYLENNYNFNNVDYFTIDGLACNLCGSVSANYNHLRNKLEELIIEGKFPYKHIIVDEGQDFGIPDLDDSGVLELLSEYGNEADDTSFFIFYDKYQLVNGSKDLPNYLNNVDSKLTLYKNCRNTQMIANTAYTLIDKKPIVYEGCIKGSMPVLCYYHDAEELKLKLDKLIDKISKSNNEDRVLITCSSMLSNSLNDVIKNGNYVTKNNIKTKFYSASTFKGLEADNVILIDVDYKCFDINNKNFYVASSRAKKNLFIFIKLSKDEINSILINRFPFSYKINDKRKELALSLKAKISE